MLILVRHAVAVHRDDWAGSDLGRPLTPLGERQAEGLVLRLEDYPVERILCSPAVRCLQSVAPLTRQRLVPVEATSLLGVDAAPADLLELIWDDDLDDAVLCTHGELIGEVLARLVADGAVTSEAPHWPKGSAWLLQRLERPRMIGRYLPPLTYDPLLWPGGDHDPGGRVWGTVPARPMPPAWLPVPQDPR